MYVKRINAETNEVVLCEEASLYSSQVRCRALNFLSISDIADGETVRARVKIRYHHEGGDAVITRDSGDTVRIDFDRPVWAAAPGQSAVFYDADNCLVGGGIIEKRV